MKAVIYARYSSDTQREESIEGQIRECTEYAKYNDMEIVGQYIDRAFSAKTDDRPDFQRMIKDSYRKLFDTVLVWKLDRFARNRYDSAFYRYTLRKNGVRVVSAKENISNGPEGIILESLLEGIAEFYSANLSQNVKRGFKENALKGKWNGGAVPLGYRVVEHKLEVDEATASVVQKMFTMCADGYTAKQIYDYLRESRCTAPTASPSPTTACCIRSPTAFISGSTVTRALCSNTRSPRSSPKRCSRRCGRPSKSIPSRPPHTVRTTIICSRRTSSADIAGQ